MAGNQSARPTKTNPLNGTAKPCLFFRVDANPRMGMGHAMRCLALAQAWQEEGGRVIFALAERAPALEEYLKSERAESVFMSLEAGSIEDATETATLARCRGASWIVADGYQFNSDFQRKVRDAEIPLLVIDDLGGRKHCYANIILNQNIHAHEALYRERERGTRLLLGTRYALLRRQFLPWTNWKRQTAQVGRKVLVTLGGSDPHNVTLEVMRSLREVKLEKLEAVVIVGEVNSHYESLLSFLKDSQVPTRLLTSAFTQMPEWMAWADLAVAAGGITAWELAFMGVPTISLILADNQKPTVERLGEMGVIINLGLDDDFSPIQLAQIVERLLLAPEIRAEMTSRGQKLVDGEGADRVMMHLQGKTLRLRKIREGDCRLIWEWSNDPQVREAPFLTKVISWEEHVKWFNSKLKDPRCVFYIATDQEAVPLGQVRYDLNGEEAVISVSLDRNFLQKGLGSKVIECASKKLFGSSPIMRIHAHVKGGNEASMRAFVKAGFEVVGPETVQGDPAFHLLLGRSG